MTSQEAYEKLELAEGADLQTVRKKFAELHNDYRMRIDNAPTPRLKQSFEKNLELLKQAYALLNESDGMDDTASLPHTGPSASQHAFATDSGHTKGTDAEAASVKEPTLEEALAHYGLQKEHPLKQIENVLIDRKLSLQWQYSSASLDSIKAVIKQEMDKAEAMAAVIRPWLTDRMAAEILKSSSSRTAGKKQGIPAWVFVLVVILAMSVAGYFMLSKGEPISDTTNADAEKDSLVWNSATAAHTKASYGHYLQMYPEGIFSVAAKDSIAGLEEEMNETASNPGQSSQSTQHPHNSYETQESVEPAESTSDYNELVETEPIFSGCEHLPKEEQRNCFLEKLQNHILRNIKYPEEALEAEIEGNVNVVFKINKNGSVKVTETIGSNIYLENEAKRVIEKLPAFVPGTLGGKPIEVSYSYPVVFKLN